MDDLELSDGKGAERRRAELVFAELEELERAIDAELRAEAVPDKRLTELLKAALDWRERFNQLTAADRERLKDYRTKIDAWRAGEGRATYNASRRKKRKHANFDLGTMTDDQRQAHRNAQKADSAFRRRKRKAGWSEAIIKQELSKVRAKRSAKVINETMKVN